MIRLMKNKNASIERLLRQRLRKNPDPAQGLICKLSHIKQQAHFNKSEFLQMCSWKSPRPRRLYESNSCAEIRRVSIKVFAAECEKEKVELLTNLKGVGVPTASAILTLTNPQDYGVIDIRVWQLLYRNGVVVSKPSGVGFSCENWIEYLQRLRSWAQKFNVGVRDVERVLFEYHKEKQEGQLYRAGTESKARLGMGSEERGKRRRHN
jgi:thermostable 8-oxoguanine DNA glycosylase